VTYPYLKTSHFDSKINKPIQYNIAFHFGQSNLLIIEQSESRFSCGGSAAMLTGCISTPYTDGTKMAA